MSMSTRTENNLMSNIYQEMICKKANNNIKKSRTYMNYNFNILKVCRHGDK